MKLDNIFVNYISLSLVFSLFMFMLGKIDRLMKERREGVLLRFLIWDFFIFVTTIWCAFRLGYILH